jgi:alpha-L-arabinofuranosidase
VAGAGAYLWEAGDVVTAANLQQYVQDQVVAVYADATARNNAYGGAGEPTLSEGMLCFLKDSDTLQYYNGSSWVNLIVPVTFNAKGDLLTASADDTPAILSVGTNGYVLTADSTAPNGIAWAETAAAGADVLQVQVFS